MNIAEILRDCPKGTKLYSPIFGEVSFYEIDIHEDKYPIIVIIDALETFKSFTKSGAYLSWGPGECLLFPSKENRDWSTFKVPKKQHKVKSFDKVPIRDFNNEKL